MRNKAIQAGAFAKLHKICLLPFLKTDFGSGISFSTEPNSEQEYHSSPKCLWELWGNISEWKETYPCICLPPSVLKLQIKMHTYIHPHKAKHFGQTMTFSNFKDLLQLSLFLKSIHARTHPPVCNLPGCVSPAEHKAGVYWCPQQTSNYIAK